MKLKKTVFLVVMCLLLLTGCSDSQVLFTPQVIEVSSATETIRKTPNPTDTLLVEETEVTTPTVEIINEFQIDSVVEFPDPSAYQWTEVVSGFNKPLGMASYDDGKLLIYVLEQDGIIRVIEDGVLLSAPFLDIKNKTTTRGSEQGLLGMALDPDFTTNGIFYLNR